jgi:hypothetical protein
LACGDGAALQRRDLRPPRVEVGQQRLHLGFQRLGVKRLRPRPRLEPRRRPGAVAERDPHRPLALCDLLVLFARGQRDGDRGEHEAHSLALSHDRA